MSTVLAWLIFFVILAWILVGLFAQVWEESAEIAREEQKRKDWRELNRWKQRASHTMVHIKDLDGEEFILRK